MITTAPPRGSPSAVEHSLQGGRSIDLEIRRACGFCGDDWWHYELPIFRLYGDGLILFRSMDPDQGFVPYRTAVLSERQHEELLLFALDDGGLRTAKPNYPGSGDDSGSTTFAIDARTVDNAGNKLVVLSDASGSQVDDGEMRARLGRLAETLFHFDVWLRHRDIESQPFEPSAYAAAMLWTAEGETIEPWPWADLHPSDFSEPENFGLRLARLTPAQAAQVSAVPGGDRVGTLWSSPGMVSDVYVRPVLPGDDVPGAFGLRPDTVAVAVTDRLRVRSLPEVSEASSKLEPLLHQGDALYVVDGPAYGSGYRWYQVYAPRTDLSGWVAWADKDGAAWIEARPLACTTGPSNDSIVAEIGFGLMNLACFKGQILGGQGKLAAVSGDGLRCPDAATTWLEPMWLSHPVRCSYDVVPADDDGRPDLISDGVFHPGIDEAALAIRVASADPMAGVSVEVTGQFDHPDARACVAVGGDPPAPIRATLTCRSTFVITGIRRPS